MKDASIAIGKNSHYFGNLKKKRPDYFTDINLLKLGISVIIKGSDVKKVMKRVKKEGDPPLTN